mgnify:CR=1 FL=1
MKSTSGDFYFGKNYSVSSDFYFKKEKIAIRSVIHLFFLEEKTAKEIYEKFFLYWTIHTLLINPFAFELINSRAGEHPLKAHHVLDNQKLPSFWRTDK